MRLTLLSVAICWLNVAATYHEAKPSIRIWARLLRVSAGRIDHMVLATANVMNASAAKAARLCASRQGRSLNFDKACGFSARVMNAKRRTMTGSANGAIAAANTDMAITVLCAVSIGGHRLSSALNCITAKLLSAGGIVDVA